MWIFLYRSQIKSAAVAGKPLPNRKSQYTNISIGFQKKYSLLYLLTCCCEPGFGILDTAPESFLHLSIPIGWFQLSDPSPFTIKIYLRHVVTTPEIHASLGEKGQVTQEQSLHPPNFYTEILRKIWVNSCLWKSEFYHEICGTLWFTPKSE